MSRYKNQCYQFDLTTLTPLHIGTGEEIVEYEYVYDSQIKCLHVLDFDKIIEHPKVSPNELAKEMREEEFNTGGFLKEKNIDISEAKLYSAHCEFTPNREIRKFIKHLHQNCYVPGTTTKGAIRTAVLWKMIRDTPEALEAIKHSNDLANCLEDYGRHASNPRTQQIILAEVLELEESEQAESYLSIMYEFCGKDYEKAKAGNSGEFLELSEIKELSLFSKKKTEVANTTIEKLFGHEPHFDFMRSVHVSDSEHIKAKPHIIKVNLYDKKKTSFRKNSLSPILVEAIPKGVSLKVNLEIESFLFSEKAEELKFSEKKHYIEPTQDFFTVCNNFSAWFLEKEKEFYRDGVFEDTANWCEKKAEETEELTKACLLPIGWSTGWRGKTVGKEIQAQEPSLFNLLCRQYGLKDSISRKLTHTSNRPLGWIKLSLQE